MKILRVLGKRGRITIPFEIRMRKGFSYNDVVSFEESDNGTVILRREKICNNCSGNNTVSLNKPTDAVTLMDFLDELSPEEQRAALVHLSCKYSAI